MEQRPSFWIIGNDWERIVNCFFNPSSLIPIPLDFLLIGDTFHFVAEEPCLYNFNEEFKASGN